MGAGPISSVHRAVAAPASRGAARAAAGFAAPPWVRAATRDPRLDARVVKLRRVRDQATRALGLLAVATRSGPAARGRLRRDRRRPRRPARQRQLSRLRLPRHPPRYPFQDPAARDAARRFRAAQVELDARWSGSGFPASYEIASSIQY